MNNAAILNLSESELSRLAEKITKLAMIKENLVSDEKELDDLREEIADMEDRISERKEKMVAISREIETLISKRT